MGHIIGGNDVAYIDTGCDGHLWKSSAPLVGARPGRGVTATGITGAQLRGRFDGPGGRVPPLVKDQLDLTRGMVRGVTATGITGASLQVEGVGDFETLEEVHFSKDVWGNLISANQLLNVGCTMRATATVLEMVSPTGVTFIRATRARHGGGLFAVKLKDIKAFAKTTNGVGTDASGRPRLNANDIKRATLARAAHVNSGHIDGAAMFFFFEEVLFD